MKKAFIELRIYWAEILLGWAIDIVPANTESGQRMIAFVMAYLESEISSAIKRNNKKLN